MSFSDKDFDELFKSLSSRPNQNDSEIFMQTMVMASYRTLLHTHCMTKPNNEKWCRVCNEPEPCRVAMIVWALGKEKGWLS